MKKCLTIPEGQEHCCDCGFLEERREGDGYCFLLHKSLRTMEPCTSLWDGNDTRLRKDSSCPAKLKLEDSHG